MGSNTVKQQHYVPRFYLRNFADAADKIWAYDKVKDRVFNPSIEGVAVEGYFYDSEEAEKAFGDKQVVEKFMVPLETMFSRELTELLLQLRGRRFSILSEQTKAAIALFASYQMIRTKEHRIMFSQITQMLDRLLGRDSRTEGMPADEKKKVFEKEQRESHARTMLDFEMVQDVAEILCGHIWVIQRRHPLYSFYTSDHPITTRGHINDPFRGTSGLACKGVEVNIPLSQDYCLGLFERTYFANMQHADGRMIPLPSDQNMIYARQFQVRASSRFVFCRDDDFAFAKQLCTEFPVLRNPDRARFVSN